MSRKGILRTLYDHKMIYPMSCIYHVTIDPKVHGTSRKDLYTMLNKLYFSESDCVYLAVVNETAEDTGMEHFHGFMGFEHRQERKHFSNKELTVLYKFGNTKGWAKYCTKGHRKITHYGVERKRIHYFYT